MQEFVKEKESLKGLKTLSLEDKQKLVGDFAWIIQEDKKQNPELYQFNKQKNND